MQYKDPERVKAVQLGSQIGVAGKLKVCKTNPRDQHLLRPYRLRLILCDVRKHFLALEIGS